MADKKKMSVAEILAAARKTDGQEGTGGGTQEADESPAQAAAVTDDGATDARSRSRSIVSRICSLASRSDTAWVI